VTLAVRDLPQADADAARGRLVAAFPDPEPPPFFLLRVIRENGVVVAQEVNIDVYGSGSTDDAAIEDFLAAAHAHRAVLESQSRLSRRLHKQLDYLRERIPA